MKKIYRFLVLSVVFWLFAYTAQAQTITGLSNSSYTEGGTPYLIDNNVAVSGGSSWGGGYLKYNVTNANVGDQLNMTSGANPNALGAVSVSGGVVYLGTGTSTDPIGSIDATYNGQNGNALQINFSSNFTNSSFENGLGGWTVGNSWVNLGVTSIAGYVTPNDLTNPANAGNDDAAPGFPYWGATNNVIYNYNINNSQHTDGNYALQLYSQMTVSTGCDVVHGPYVYSYVFQSSAGDVIYFDWRAYAGWDAYDVFGYILNVNTGATTVVLNETGASYASTSNWSTASVSIPANGSYRFVFVSGTWDATCGYAAGASLYIDNVRVYGDKVNDAVVSKIANMVTYQNACGTSGADRNLALTVHNSGGGSATANATITLNTIAPVALCKNIDAYLGSNGSVTVAENEIDNGSYDNCSLTFDTDINTFGCSDLGVHNVTLTVYDSYGTSATCPATITVYDQIGPNVITKNITLPLGSSGNATITPSMVDNGTSDACGIASMTVSPNIFSCSNIGLNTVTFTSTDINGNSSSGTAVVNVVDATQPSVVAQNKTVYLDANGNATITINDIDAGTTDNCGIASMTLSSTNFSCSKIGNNTVTLTATDASNNVGTAQAIVAVVDNILPTINCTADITASATSASGAVVNYSIPTGSDNCTYTISQIAGLPSGSVFPIGTTTNTYQIIDASNNSVQCSFNVTVNGVAPQVVCPGNITLNNGSGQCGAIANYIATETTGIPASTITYSIPSGSAFAFGTTTVTATATNPVGTSFCTFDITVIDNEQPIAITQNPTIYLDANGVASVTPAAVNNGSSDNCGIATMTLDKTNFDCSNVGANTVTLTVTDIRGNVNTAQATVTVVDNILPTVITQNQTIYLDANGQASITVAMIDNGSFDNCSVATLVLDNMNFDCANVGANTVTLTATDVNGNVNSAQATVTVVDNILPTVLTQNQTIYLDANGQASITVPMIDNESFDNCSIATLVLDNMDFNCGNVGANTVTLTATDVNGNANSATASVTVVDNIAPTVSGCPSNITVNNLFNNCFQMVVYAPPTFSDNCGIDTVFFTNNAGVVCYQAACCANQVQGAFPVGVTTVTYTAIDVNGNVSTCSFDITVVDTEPPTLNNCPSDITLNNDPGTCQRQFVFWTPPTPSDNCPSWSMTASHFPGQTFPVGTTQVTYMLVDNAGDTIICSFNVTIADNEAPVAICQGLTINLDANGQASITAADIDNGSYDNCGIQSLTLSQYNFDCGQLGANTVTLTVLDIHGNTSTCLATVVVEDHIAPVALAKNITVALDANGQASITPSDVDNGSYDNCSFNLTVSPSSFDCNNTGANTVTLTATDAAGNITSITATVTIIDNLAPVVLTQGTTVYLDANGQASITTADVDNGTYDNCTFTLSVQPNTFDCLKTGANTVTLSAIDASGNTSYNTAIVNVIDAINPTVITQNATIYLDANGQASINTSMIDNASYDNCSIASLTLDKTQFDCSNLGANNVTLTAIDASNNVGSATATVTLIDAIAPTITGCPADITVYAQSAICSGIATWTVPSASDNCTVSSLTSDYNSGHIFPLGSTVVTYTATDNSGNVTTCSFTVYVIPTPLVISYTSPTFNGNNISCHGASDGSIDVTLTGGCLPYSYSWSNGATSEDLTGLSAGIYTLIAMDANGATISLTITLTEPAELTAAVVSDTFIGGTNTSCNGSSDGNADLSVSGGTTPYFYSWSNGAVSEDLSSIGAGTYTVVVTDLNGCSVSATITLTEPDVLTTTLTPSTYAGGFNVSCEGSADGSITTASNGGTAPYTYVWSDGSTADNLSMIESGNYTVTITDQNGCSASAQIYLSEPTEVIANAGTDATICKGSDVQLGGSPTAQGGAAPYTFAWSPATSLDHTNIANPTADPTHTTNYVLNVYDQNGCMASDQVKVTVRPLPEVAINLAVTDTFCRKVSLVASSAPGSYDYLWSNGETGSSITLDPETDPAGTYSLYITNMYGCQSEAATYVYDPTSLVTSYTIIAFKDMNLGEKNYVLTGSVGLTGKGRQAKVMKYAEINGPNAFLKADNIQAMAGSDVPNKIYDPAVVNLPFMHYYQDTYIKGYIKVKDNKTTTISTDLKDIKIGRNCNVTLTGNNYGVIEIDRGSSVTFTASDLNIQKIITKKAYSSDVTEINFSANTIVRALQNFYKKVP